MWRNVGIALWRSAVIGGYDSHDGKRVVGSNYLYPDSQCPALSLVPIPSRVNAQTREKTDHGADAAIWPGGRQRSIRPGRPVKLAEPVDRQSISGQGVGARSPPRPLPSGRRTLVGLESERARAGAQSASSDGTIQPLGKPMSVIAKAMGAALLHADRAAAERCGVLLGGAPELVRLEEVRPGVYRVRGLVCGRLEDRPPTARQPR